ncbi:hypothetical protein BS47DRAFT_23196 [Hydnum rufescens UP504]|uniref:Uncharacterized protein n=1 Tax=Hydnum rufescens UP504 TaxID=1448309 RepID=A0A9P6E1D4_9AGAM|nr:hypothetical protein BS47DRAFT_23196 [Hydnum rufescens UP504]
MENMCDDSLYPSVLVQNHARLAIYRRASHVPEVDGFGSQSTVVADVLEAQQNDVILPAKSSLDGMGNLDEGVYRKSDSVSTRPQIVLRTAHPVPVKSVGMLPSPDTLNENEERSAGDKSHLHPNAGRPLSLALSQPSSRLAISVIPHLDDEMRHLETMLMGVSSVEEIDLSSLHGTLEDDESDTGSFEGQLTDISTYHRTHFFSRHEDRIGDSNVGNNNWSKLPIDKEEYSDEYAYDDERDDAAYDLSLNYLSDTYPILPRQAEVALRAIEREGGRAIEGEQIVRHFDASRGPGQNFAPAISSPLRVSHRLSVASVNSLASKASDGSQYSQTS